MKRIPFLFIFIILLINFGCVTPGPKYTWKIEPIIKGVENEYFSAYISPTDKDYFSGGYKAFDLIIKNKISEDVELDWNKTMYIENGQTQGGFMFEGIVYKDRNNPKQPDIIFAGTKFFKKTIWPNNLVSFRGNWYRNEIPPGQNGIYLTIRIKGKEINEKIILNMSKVPIQTQFKNESSSIKVKQITGEISDIDLETKYIKVLKKERILGTVLFNYNCLNG